MSAELVHILAKTQLDMVYTSSYKTQPIIGRILPLNVL